MSDMRNEPRLASVTCANPAGMHRMAYWEWGDPDNPRVLMCVHGLTRTGRDFDRLARCLVDQYRIICPDVVGRGQSDWLTNPAFYSVPQYVADMVTLVAHLAPKTLHWVGTSMGGLIGLALGGTAALAQSHRYPTAGEHLLRADEGLRLDKLVLNDVGPHLNPPALDRIGQYVGQPAEFSSFAAAREQVRENCAPFGPHTDEQWDELARHVYVKSGNVWVKHYDTRLAGAFGQHNAMALMAGEQLLWQAFDALDCPVMVLRGEHSDLFTDASAQEMVRRKPGTKLQVFEGVGHAPTLMHDAQIDPVLRFLLEDSPPFGEQPTIAL